MICPLCGGSGCAPAPPQSGRKCAHCRQEIPLHHYPLRLLAHGPGQPLELCSLGCLVRWAVQTDPGAAVSVDVVEPPPPRQRFLDISLPPCVRCGHLAGLHTEKGSCTYGWGKRIDEARAAGLTATSACVCVHYSAD